MMIEKIRLEIGGIQPLRICKARRQIQSCHKDHQIALLVRIVIMESERKKSDGKFFYSIADEKERK